MDFLANINFRDIDEQSTKRGFDEVNRYADIPLRFSETRLGKSEDEKTMFDFATKPVSDAVLILSGGVGTGKTSRLCGAMHERAVLGMSAGKYLSCRTLCAKIRTSKSFSARINEEELYEMYSKTPFLVIDEFGRGDDEKLELQFISTVLALRYDNNLRTAIGTNLSLGNVKNVLANNGAGEDLVDRLSSVLIPMVLDGNSLRKPKY